MLVTQDCNYNCVMCHGEGLQEEKEATLSPDDFAFIFRVGKERLGMDTTTLTGGEPLFRKDIVEIAKNLHEEGAKITLTTNGRLLTRRMEVGKYLDRINVSVHTMNEEKYEDLVQVKNSFHSAMHNLRAFRQAYPEVSIVLNTTCIRGFNSEPDDFKSLVEFAKSIRASIKLIELFPPDRTDVVSLEEVTTILTALGFVPTETELRKRKLSDGQTTVSLTRIFCAEAVNSGDPAAFCNQQNDVFISPDGFAKPCRSDSMEVDLNSALRSRNEDEMERLIKHAFAETGRRCVYDRNNLSEMEAPETLTEKYGERAYVLEKLEAYRGVDAEEDVMRLDVVQFVKDHENCFDRSLSTGHVTGSALVVDPGFNQTLLTHHMKLDRWFQFGGHSDGDWNTLRVAMREALEESGLKSLRPYSGNIFSIDVHPIPERGDEPEHKHYDVRFLLIGDPREPSTTSSESKELRWVNLDDAARLNPSDAMRRMVEKAKRLK